MELNNTYTVYMHKNKINSKVYIGITSKLPQLRWGKNGKGYKSQIFYNAILKYGWDNFEHKILYTGLSNDDANSKEIELISVYKSNNHKYGYNVSIGGDKSVKGLYDISKNNRHIFQYDLKGNFIKEWKSINSIKRDLGIENCNIISCCNGRLGYCNNFQWRYTYYEKLDIAKTRSQKIKESKYKIVYQYDYNGNFLKSYDSVIETEKDGFGYKNISACCLGKRLSAYGFRWSYIYKEKLDKILSPKERNANGTKKSVCQFDLNNNYIATYESAAEADKITGINYKYISKSCLGKVSQTHGYIFKFADAS